MEPAVGGEMPSCYGTGSNSLKGLRARFTRLVAATASRAGACHNKSPAGKREQKQLSIVFDEVFSTKQGALGAICNCEAKRLCDLSGREA